ncbi:MAG: hypothetical protein EPO20_30605 [Betaproteobacteria bacterium]|nr:MAG: hypothetical protein EPO20_30605 [Betaproteobacteria bacterium]
MTPAVLFGQVQSILTVGKGLEGKRLVDNKPQFQTPYQLASSDALGMLPPGFEPNKQYSINTGPEPKKPDSLKGGYPAPLPTRPERICEIYSICRCNGFIDFGSITNAGRNLSTSLRPSAQLSFFQLSLSAFNSPHPKAFPNFLLRLTEGNA